MLSRVLQELVIRWGYVAIALATFIEGEVVLLWAGALVHAGLLSLPLVALAATVGSFAWGQSWFYVGKYLGRAFVDKRPGWRARIAKAEPWIARYGSLCVVAFRFVAGMAIVLPLLVGASGYSARRFFVLDGIGAFIWACGFACTGYALGSGVGKILGRAVNWPELVGVAFGGALTIWLLSQFVRALIARHTRRHAHQTNV
jgi:membrane protein DedA with SNARE-associated domain